MNKFLKISPLRYIFFSRKKKWWENGSSLNGRYVTRKKKLIWHDNLEQITHVVPKIKEDPGYLFIIYMRYIILKFLFFFFKFNSRYYLMSIVHRFGGLINGRRRCHPLSGHLCGSGQCQLDEWWTAVTFFFWVGFHGWCDTRRQLYLYFFQHEDVGQQRQMASTVDSYYYLLSLFFFFFFKKI